MTGPRGRRPLPDVEAVRSTTLQTEGAAAVTSRGPRQPHLAGFDLHANVWVSADDRAGLERLCRYVLRPL